MSSARAPGKLRIIAGAWRGRNIAVLPVDAIRPTADRVRQSLFNRLDHGVEGFALQSAKVLDVFAGTGALGLEALSRGASHVTFVERNADALALIRRNVEQLGAEDRASIFPADATNLPRAAGAADLAFLDPPYGESLAAKALASLARQGWLRPGALVSVETGADEALDCPAGYDLIDRRAYGRATITLLRTRARSDQVEST